MPLRKIVSTPVKSKWPKILPPLTAEQQRISDDFMKLWHEILPRRFGIVDVFNQTYPVTHAPPSFLTTLEIGAGLGEHLSYENLAEEQKKNYWALDIRPNMIEELNRKQSGVHGLVGDCQKPINFPDDFFDRILAIHVLEHLTDLPAAIHEMWRLCNKSNGILSVLIPCEGGPAYGLARRLSAQRIFVKRYHQSYTWFKRREHINKPAEILAELRPYFKIKHRSYFPLKIRVSACNLCIGLTCTPRAHPQTDA